MVWYKADDFEEQPPFMLVHLGGGDPPLREQGELLHTPLNFRFLNICSDLRMGDLIQCDPCQLSAVTTVCLTMGSGCSGKPQISPWR